MGIFANYFPDGVLGIKGVRRERALTDELIGGISANDRETLGAEIDQARQPLTVKQHQAIRTALIGKIEDLNTVRDITGALDQHLSELRKSANEDEKNDLDGFATQLKTAHALAVNSNPELQKQGLAALQGLAQAQTTWATNAEKSRVELEGLRDAPGIAGEQQRYTRDMDLSTKLSTAIKPVDDQLDALHVALALNNDPKADNIERQLAFNNVITALDPGGRRDPDGRYAGANGIAIQLQNAYERALGQKDSDAFKAVNEIIGSAQKALSTNRDRTVATFRRQTEAYGGDVNRVLSVVPEYQPPQPVETPQESGPLTTKTEAPAREPGLLEKAAAAAKAGYEVTNANVPDSVKEAVGLGTVLSSSKWAPWLLRGIAANPATAVAVAGVGGLSALTQADPRQGLAVAPEEVQPNGTVRGVYVPKFLRKKIVRNTDEYPKP